MLRVGTLNLYWYGLLSDVAAAENLLGIDFYHPPADDAQIGALIRAMGADLLVFEEIVDIKRLEQVLVDVSPDWRIRDQAGVPVVSEAPGNTPDALQRVVIAWKSNALRLVRLLDPPIQNAGGPRRPVVVRFATNTGTEFTVVGVHPKSGLPKGWEGLPPESKDYKAGVARQRFFATVAEWLSTPPLTFGGPHAILAGDFNAAAGGRDTEPLRVGALSTWSWSQPEFSPSTAERRTTKTDPEIIDHILLSPALAARQEGPARALAFDVDPAFLAPTPNAPSVWKRTTDHRPVFLNLNLA